MRAGGWLSSPGGWIFAAAMLLVMVVTGWLGFRVDTNGFALNVLASVFSIALSLLIGYLLVDNFADYVAERQWARTRLYTLRAIAAHLCDMGSEACSYFFVFDPEILGRVLKGRDRPNKQSVEGFDDLLHYIEPMPSAVTKDKSTSDIAVEFLEAVHWDIQEVQTVLIPRIIQSSRNQILVDALMVWDDACRTLQNAVIGHRLAVTNSVFPHLLRVVEVSGQLYSVVADEWGKCLPKDAAEVAD